MVDHSTHLWSMDILSTNISPGSVATHSRDGEIFYYCFTKNLLLSLLVKIFFEKMHQNQYHLHGELANLPDPADPHLLLGVHIS